MNKDWIENERKLFEVIAVEHGYNMRRSKRTSMFPIDDYVNSNTGNMWAGWLTAKRSIISDSPKLYKESDK